MSYLAFSLPLYASIILAQYLETQVLHPSSGSVPFSSNLAIWIQVEFLAQSEGQNSAAAVKVFS